MDLCYPIFHVTRYPLGFYFRLGHMVQMLLMLIISPPALLYIAALVESNGGKQFSYGLWPGKAWDVLKQSLFLSILDNYLIGNWIFSFFSFAVMPSWLMSWAVTRIGRWKIGLSLNKGFIGTFSNGRRVVLWQSTAIWKHSTLCYCHRIVVFWGKKLHFILLFYFCGDFFTLA